jgi:hypothetical protein
LEKYIDKSCTQLQYLSLAGSHIKNLNGNFSNLRTLSFFKSPTFDQAKLQAYFIEQLDLRGLPNFINISIEAIQSAYIKRQVTYFDDRYEALLRFQRYTSGFDNFDELRSRGQFNTANIVLKFGTNENFRDFWNNLNFWPEQQLQLAQSQQIDAIEYLIKDKKSLAYLASAYLDEVSFDDFWNSLSGFPNEISALAIESYEQNKTLAYQVLSRFHAQTIVKFWCSLIDKAKQTLALSTVEQDCLLAHLALKKLPCNLFMDTIWNSLTPETQKKLLTDHCDAVGWNILSVAILRWSSEDIEKWIKVLQQSIKNANEWKTLLWDRKDQAGFNVLDLSECYRPRLTRTLLGLLPRTCSDQWFARREKTPRYLQIDALGNTPMHRAAFRDDVAELDKFIRKEYSFDERNQTTGATPVLWAIKGKSIQALRWYEELSPQSLHTTDHHLNAIDYADEINKEEIDHYIEVMNFLLPKRVKINTRLHLEKHGCEWNHDGSNAHCIKKKGVKNKQGLKNNDDVWASHQTEEEYNNEHNIYGDIKSPSEELFNPFMTEMPDQDEEKHSFQEEYFKIAESGKLGDEWLAIKDIDLHAIDAQGDHALILALRGAIARKLVRHPAFDKMLQEFCPNAVWLIQHTLLRLTDDQINCLKERCKLLGASNHLLIDLDRMGKSKNKPNKPSKLLNRFNLMSRNTSNSSLQLFYHRTNPNIIC